MPTLPSVLDDHDLPAAELAAMRLDGELYPLAGAYCPIDQIETAAHRARAVRGRRSPRLIAELGTAAWVWGAIPRLPAPVEFCVDLAARARLRPNPHTTVRELVLDPEDVVDLDGSGVTSPLRTAVDLARFQDAFDPDAVAALAAIGGFGWQECLAVLDRRRNLPAKNRAKARLQPALRSAVARTPQA